MRIRPFAASDLPTLIDIAIATFRPYFVEFVHPLLGDELFQLQHGQWEQDYRDDVPTLHDPAAGRHIAVAEDGEAIAGYVSWKISTDKPDHGEIYLLAVSSAERRAHVGRDLCLHAIERMRADGIRVVGIGTGDDAFHGAARALYESLGFTKIPIAGYLKLV